MTAEITTYYRGCTLGQIFCINCSPYRLTGSIRVGRKNQKNFKGYDNEMFRIMTAEEVAHMQAVLDQDAICYC